MTSTGGRRTCLPVDHRVGAWLFVRGGDPPRPRPPDDRGLGRGGPGRVGEWPAALAPYHILITLVKHDDAKQREVAEQLAGQLSVAGVDVLIDDRDDRPGPKFKDGDLIGVPIRLTLGEKSLAEGAVEFKRRADAGKGELVKIEDAVAKSLGVLNA